MPRTVHERSMITSEAKIRSVSSAGRLYAIQRAVVGRQKVVSSLTKPAIEAMPSISRSNPSFFVCPASILFQQGEKASNPTPCDVHLRMFSRCPTRSMMPLCTPLVLNGDRLAVVVFGLLPSSREWPTTAMANPRPGVMIRCVSPITSVFLRPDQMAAVAANGGRHSSRQLESQRRKPLPRDSESRKSSCRGRLPRPFQVTLRVKKNPSIPHRFR